MKPPAETRRLLRTPLIITVLGGVIAAGAWIWNRAECCEGGANIGAGMLWMLGLAVLIGGGVWTLAIVLAGLSNRRSASGEGADDATPGQR